MSIKPTPINNEFEYKAVLNKLGKDPKISDFLNIVNPALDKSYEFNRIGSYFHMLCAIDYFYPLEFRTQSFKNLFSDYSNRFSNNVFYTFIYNEHHEDLGEFFLKHPIGIDFILNHMKIEAEEFKIDNFFALIRCFHCDSNQLLQAQEIVENFKKYT